MCLKLITINYEGYIYDCDFNLAIDKKIKGYENQKFWEIDFDDFNPEISLFDHCYACTVSQGSSCHGALENDFNTIEVVKNYYGEEIQTTSDLKTEACCTNQEIPDYIKEPLSLIADEIMVKYYGCGSPIPMVLDGLKALDLGSGTGRDVYVLSKLVGENGFASGIDMTENQINIANKYIDHQTEVFEHKKPNVNFFLDKIENMTKYFKPESLDLITSNCVLNLLEDKKLVLKQIYKLLKNGGELYFSDVYSDRRIPDHIRKNEVIYGECLGGALYYKDFVRFSRTAGFADPRIVSRREIKIDNEKIKNITGNIKFYSITYRLWKINGMEDDCEDYGHVAVYNGGIKESPFVYKLDNGHAFEKNKPERVCGNTAKMLSETRLSKYFKIIGDFSEHFGAYEGCRTLAASDNKNENEQKSSCC
jgi:ubiquinone/menaquinone biosynthesis C-methylase UbiE